MDNNRFKDLARRAENTGKDFFTPFLGLADQAALHTLPIRSYTLFGGTENCERLMARFGPQEAPFPIACLHITPVNIKFAEELSHRDYLGALINLGLERDVLGDLILSENEAWLFLQDHLAGFVASSLTRVRHTTVRAEAADAPPSAAARTEAVSLTVASARADCVLAALWKLSRADALELFSSELVFVNGAVVSASRLLEDGDIVSCRGKGRFRFGGADRRTKKGRLAITVQKFY